jgi:hypothetical protein
MLCSGGRKTDRYTGAEPVALPLTRHARVDAGPWVIACRGEDAFQEIGRGSCGKINNPQSHFEVSWMFCDIQKKSKWNIIRKFWDEGVVWERGRDQSLVGIRVKRVSIRLKGRLLRRFGVEDRSP